MNLQLLLFLVFLFLLLLGAFLDTHGEVFQGLGLLLDGLESFFLLLALELLGSFLFAGQPDTNANDGIKGRAGVGDAG